MEYKVNKPYPDVRVEKENTYYAQILLCSYAGITSELTAINQYMYQVFVLEEDVKNIIEGIAIVEMKHLELLAETIKLLGVLPKYQTFSTENEIIPWSAQAVPYPKNIIEMLETDIQSEETAIRNYNKDIEIIDDKYIKELLKRIVEDEQLHLKIFNDLLKKYEK